MTASCTHEFYWYPSPATEQGWMCCYCKHKPGEPPGYSPQIDRELIGIKVASMLFDQYSICQFILEAMNGTHAKYWREVGEGILSGKDPRNRCACGKLSTMSEGKPGGGWRYWCGDCRQAWHAEGGPF